MGNITDAMLASSLKELIANDIVIRKSYDEIPPRVEYTLSEKGMSVVSILHSVCKWSGLSTRKIPKYGDTLSKMRLSLNCTELPSGAQSGGFLLRKNACYE